MKSILHVKNFGPIKDAKLDLRNVNVLIGPQASGKSTLAKLFAICKSPVMYFELKKPDDESLFTTLKIDIPPRIDITKPSFSKFMETLDFFSLTGFYKENSEISYVSSTHSVSVKNGELEFYDNLKIDDLFEFNENQDKANIVIFAKELENKSAYIRNKCIVRLYMDEFFDLSRSKKDVFREFDLFVDRVQDNEIYNEKNIPVIVQSAADLRALVLNKDATYIPAERTIVNLIKQASLNFQRSKIPIAGHLLDYAAKYESATFSVKKFDLNFISKNAEYRYENGEDRIYFSDGNSIRLTDSASGFQSVVPMLLPLVHFQDEQIDNSSAYVIEEPETNLFPGAQYEVLKYIQKGRKNDFGMIDKGAMHIYTTHSPFILSSLNNMLFGFKKGNKAPDSVRKKIDKVIPEENWINPDDFAAYEIKNGKAKSIFSRKTGLINETVIDVVSEDIMNDFRKIAVISAEANVEK